MAIISVPCTEQMIRVTPAVTVVPDDRIGTRSGLLPETSPLALRRLSGSSWMSDQLYSARRYNDRARLSYCWAVTQVCCTANAIKATTRRTEQMAPGSGN